MNASYNILVEKHLPQAQIVYDRYHMQAQFGKEVLGVVRLEEARKHKTAASEILAGFKDETDKDKRAELKRKAFSSLLLMLFFRLAPASLKALTIKLRLPRGLGTAIVMSSSSLCSFAFCLCKHSKHNHTGFREEP